MSKKIRTYEDLLVEKQNLEVLFEVQKTLVRLEIDELKAKLDPAFNALEFLKKLSTRNTKKPVMQAGLNLLMDLMSDKMKGDNTGLLRSTVIPYVLKNYASNLLEGKADDLIEYLISLFRKEEIPAREI